MRIYLIRKIICKIIKLKFVSSLILALSNIQAQSQKPVVLTVPNTFSSPFLPPKSLLLRTCGSYKVDSSGLHLPITVAGYLISSAIVPGMLITMERGVIEKALIHLSHVHTGPVLVHTR